ncbi:hypothetical protein ElyMa_003660400 [Elysia marginata]|uniref:Uncharacterized protein n=1 Tax=Elysia marginata TaxID=1093978 RepID=A0AAV4EXT6_9GAST|nr:hypothetical protein ElyMa_003660400 [Elysia marginata]
MQTGFREPRSKGLHMKSADFCIQIVALTSHSSLSDSTSATTPSWTRGKRTNPTSATASRAASLPSSH